MKDTLAIKINYYSAQEPLIKCTSNLHQNSVHTVLFNKGS